MISPSQASPRPLQGWFYGVTRVVWVTLSLLTTVVLMTAVIHLASGWWEFRLPCSQQGVATRADCEATHQALRQVGLPLEFPALFFPLGVLVETVPWLLVGGVIYWRRPRYSFEALFSLMLVITSVMNLDDGIGEMAWNAAPMLRPVVTGLGFLGQVLLLTWYLFPDGRLKANWLKWPALAWIAFSVGNRFFPDTWADSRSWPEPWPGVLQISLAASIMLAFIHRYQHVMQPAQRQQIKWVVLSGSGYAAVYIAEYVLAYLYPALSQPGVPNVLGWLTLSPIRYVSQALVAVAIGASILQYRLWDIDFLINRSLVYGALTLSLAGVFGASLFLISLVARGQALIGAFGLTAVLAGGLFNPVRRQLQRMVDQRFYHIYIDYQKTPVVVSSAPAGPQLERYGDFERGELLGRGGMAEVYKAVQRESGRPAALKILPAALAAEPDFRLRFAREAKIAAQLDHPNIIRLYGYGEQAGVYYMALEYLPGQDLGALLQARGRLPLAEARPLLSQIAAALDYAHPRGIVHRDIKPSNVMLATAGPAPRAVLTDFGIAKIVNAATVLTRTGGMVGTFDYMAPEQIQAAAEVDGRADVYALGVMTYQMLTGELPFRHDNPGATLIAHLTQPAPDPRDRISDLPETAADAVQRAMAKAPEERFATAGDFVQALGAA